MVLNFSEVAPGKIVQLNGSRDFAFSTEFIGLWFSPLLPPKKDWVALSWNWFLLTEEAPWDVLSAPNFQLFLGKALVDCILMPIFCTISIPKDEYL